MAQSSSFQSLKAVLIAGVASASLLACGEASTTTTNSAGESAAPAAVTQEIREAETARLNTWFEAKFEEELAFSPIQQTFLGRDTDKDKIDDLSPEAQDAQLAWKIASAEELKTSFDYAKLNDAGKLSYDIWMYQTDRAVKADAFRSNAYIFEQMQAIHGFFPQLLIAFHSVQTKADMEAYVSRISATKVALEQLIGLSKDYAAGGVRPPKWAFESVIDSATKIITGAPFTDGDDSAIWADAQRKVQGLIDREVLTAEEGEDILARARTALVDEWQPAYEALIAWQKDDIANADDVARGVSALPNGAAYYNDRLAANTTTSLTAEEVHQTGLAEVARLRAEMEAVKDSVGFDGDLQAFFAELRDNKDNPRYYYPDTDEGRQGYIDDATAAIDGIKAKLPDYFGILPKADLVVKRVEAFREQPGAAQHYFPGTPDGSRPGVYYAHLSDMKAMPKRELEVIAYHEGLPGHHMQISIQQELDSVPTFRTQANFTAYSEGWGLYSELLAKEIEGTYVDPYSEFGRLGSEIWRAIRLVVDTGLHAKGWTEDEAVAYFKANSAVTDAQARSEVRRYLVLPGQATSYKIGMLKILDLRRKAEAALGDAFDIKGFHDTILGGGALPLDLLERRVDQWVATVQAL